MSRMMWHLDFFGGESVWLVDCKDCGRMAEPVLLKEGLCPPCRGEELPEPQPEPAKKRKRRKR